MLTYVRQLSIRKRGDIPIRVFNHCIPLRILYNELCAVPLRQCVHLALVRIVDPGRAHINHPVSIGRGLAPCLAADTISGFKDNTRETGSQHFMRGSEPCQTGADYHHVSCLGCGGESQRDRSLFRKCDNGINLNQPARDRKFRNRNESLRWSMLAEEALDGAGVLAVGGVVVDDVDVELCDVFDVGPRGDNQLSQVEQAQVDLGLVVLGDVAGVGAPWLPGDVQHFSAGDGCWAVVEACGV